MQLAFYFDQSRCIGCNTCEVACKDWNEVGPGPASWRRLVTIEDGTFPDVEIIHHHLHCFHCAEPACMKACTANAITKRKQDGVVVVDRALCTGDRKCLEMCPFGAPQFALDQQQESRADDWKVDHPMQKCTFCLDRLQSGKKPACVDSCITRALDAGPEDEIQRRYPDAIQTAVGFPDSARKPSGTTLPWGETKPSIYFKSKYP